MRNVVKRACSICGVLVERESRTAHIKLVSCFLCKQKRNVEYQRYKKLLRKKIKEDIATR